MGTTPNFALPYPEGGIQPYVHLDLKALADAVDEDLKVVSDTAGASSMPLQDSGFPAAAPAATTADFVVSRITVPASDRARRLVCSGVCWVRYTQANDMDLAIYAGASVVGRFRKRMAADIGESLAVSSGTIILGAGQAVVLELRVIRAGGTGSFSTSTSGGLTAFNAVAAPA